MHTSIPGRIIWTSELGWQIIPHIYDTFNVVVNFAKKQLEQGTTYLVMYWTSTSRYTATEMAHDMTSGTGTCYMYLLNPSRIVTRGTN